MKEQTNQNNVVYIVTCYQNIVGVYASQDDASVAARDLILKGRISDIICRPIIQPLNNK